MKLNKHKGLPMGKPIFIYLTINNDIRSITLVRMEVPCCKALELALKKAISDSKKDIHYSIRVISTNGKIIETYC